jgi:RNA polymerase sigma factor (TIGR02999 family)
MPTPSGAGGDAAADRITAWVAAAKAGDRSAAESLYEAVYDELRRIARAQRSRRAADRGRSGDTMSTTVVVHELYLRLARAERLTVADRNHFFSLAARVMRQILIDAARRAIAHGGHAPRVELDADGLVAPERPRELLALDEALDRLGEQDRELAQLVELHFFAGLSFERIAETAGRSERTLRREWRRARAFLYDQLANSA